jgi:hypothetical protein
MHNVTVNISGRKQNKNWINGSGDKIDLIKRQKWLSQSNLCSPKKYNWCIFWRYKRREVLETMYKSMVFDTFVILWKRKPMLYNLGNNFFQLYEGLGSILIMHMQRCTNEKFSRILQFKSKRKPLLSNLCNTLVNFFERLGRVLMTQMQGRIQKKVQINSSWCIWNTDILWLWWWQNLWIWQNLTSLTCCIFLLLPSYFVFLACLPKRPSPSASFSAQCTHKSPAHYCAVCFTG